MLFEGGRLIGRSSPRTWGCVVYATVIFLSPILFIGLSSPCGAPQGQHTYRSHASLIAGQLRRLVTWRDCAGTNLTNFLLHPLLLYLLHLFLHFLFFYMKFVVWWCRLLARRDIKAPRRCILPASKPHRPPSSLDRRSRHPYSSTFVTGWMYLFFSQD